MLGKRFRVPGHGWSYRGGSGRKCSCSSFQRRPGHETSRQGGPGRATDVFIITLCFNTPCLWSVTESKEKALSSNARRSVLTFKLEVVELKPTRVTKCQT